jgi:general secretion pathway protein F/type IV pilus assembly protein PilC
MLANGVPMLQALKISKDATGSTLKAEQIAHAADSVRTARRCRSAGGGRMFPEQVLAMITVAEESNKLDKVYAADCGHGPNGGRTGRWTRQ